MGLISLVKSVFKSNKNDVEYREIKSDKSGGDNVSSEHFSNAGDDSQPLSGDYAVLLEIPRNGGMAAIGYIDPKNAPKAGDGEKRSYGRNAQGDEVNQVWLKSDGTVIIGNDSITLTLTPNNTITINNGSEEFVKTLSDALQEVIDITTNTIYGTSPINNKVAVQDVKDRLDTFKG